MSRYWLVAIVVLALMVPGLAGCGPGADEQPAPPKPSGPTTPSTPDAPDDGPAPGGTVYLTMWSEPDMFNPLLLRDTYSRLVAQAVFSTLVKYNAEYEIVGDLARDWEFSDDQLSITFYLHDNVLWHDGTPLTAYDVEFSLLALMDPEYPGVYFSDVNTILGATAYRAGESDEVPGIEVIDDHTIRLTTVSVDARLMDKMTRGVVPKHILGQVPVSEWSTHPFNLQPVGSGPFEFVQYMTSQYVELRKNTNYFLAEPYIDTIIWKIGDQNSLLAAFMNREVDVINVPLPEVDTVEQLDFADIHTFASGYQWLGMNLTQERFQDVRVRQALAHALNRHQIVNSLLRGYGFVCDIPYPPDSWQFNPDTDRYEFDAQRARELLDEAGWTLNARGRREKDGEEFKVTLIYPTGQLTRMQSAPVVQLNLDAVGIECELRALDFPTLVSRIQPAGRPVEPGDYDIFLMGLSFYLDPDLSILMHSNFIWPDGWNLSSYRNAKVDELLDKGLSYLDPERRAPHYRELAAEIARDVPVIYLYATDDVVAVNQRVNNVVPVPHTIGITHNVTEWWIPADRQ